ncbi:WD40-repeat-containing domain protein [Phakopsora pachyrhizi]|nr:WD40-repeat-containing domain protein [Phakopsora pachyrhizi]
MEDNSVDTNLMVPCQRITTTIDKNLIITSSGNLIRVSELSNGWLVSCEISDGLDRSSDSHTGLIRSLLVIENQCGGTDPQLLVSTGEDKLLKIWKLPTLSLISSRELVKRPTSIAISPDGKSIVIADKSGDVYDLPINCPSDTEFLADPDQEEVSDESLSKTLKPIAGHVSVITSIALIPPDCEGIDGGVLLSGGGDYEVYVWDHLALKCRRRIAVGDRLKDGLKVRHPLLNWRVIDLLSGLPVHLKPDHGLGKGLGDNLLLRGLAHGLRLVESCRLPKQAIQFGAQSAKLDGNSKGQAG